MENKNFDEVTITVGIKLPVEGIQYSNQEIQITKTIRRPEVITDELETILSNELEGVLNKWKDKFGSMIAEATKPDATGPEGTIEKYQKMISILKKKIGKDKLKEILESK